ncbi:putative 2-dehydro-3-deoxyglucarate aldolase [Xylariaceae sp. FL0255]|nr:putative 2-dehydro-3-deoxyglucarate aldolase [Xylariaceae sp. FL0255]
MLDAKDYNAMDLAQPTNFRAMLRSGELLWGTSCRIPSEEAARIVATLPHQFCFIDTEHAPLNATLVASLVRTIQQYSGGSMVPFVRIAPNSLDLVTYVLNAGAGGIVLPHVQNASQARALVRASRFPPHGDRSYPPLALLGRQQRTPPGTTVYDVWNNHAAVFCQIEDLEGLANIDEICAVPGVDALMVGVADLRCSMGYPVGSQDGEEPEFLAAMTKIQRAADKNNLAVLGFAMTDEILQRRVRLGWRALIIHSDGYGIFNSGTQSLEHSVKVSRGLKQVNGYGAALNGGMKNIVNGEKIALRSMDGFRPLPNGISQGSWNGI